MSITFSLARRNGDEIVHVASDFDLNVSNVNAMLIFERLGIDPEPWGEIDPAEFLGRALVANVGRSDEGTAPSVDRFHEDGATWVDCGLRPGYFEDRFGALATLATVAVERDLIISWG